MQNHIRTQAVLRFVLREGLAMFVLLALLWGPASATLALVARDDKEQAVERSFQDALAGAVQTYQVRTSAQAHRTRRLGELEREKQALTEVMGEKTLVRRKIVFLEDMLDMLGQEYGVIAEATSSGAVAKRASAFEELERHAARIAGRQPVRDVFVHVVSKALRGSPGMTTVHEPLRELTSARQERGMLQAYLVARSTEDTLQVLRTRHNELIADTGAAQQSVEQAQKLVARSEAEIRQIQAIMRDVHTQVLQLQADMARIDARLKARAERALIEFGLLPPNRRGGTGTVVSSAPQIQWPAKGRISAGFQDSSYAKFFGVPHHGIDIVVKESTPVRAAADGVVFLVRDGGDTGYTYVLIGHSAGLATLYGHLRTVAVATGQDVNVGQVIGLSGGRPGTPGAGPLTTAAHLHFEVIQNGSNIDPRSVLP